MKPTRKLVLSILLASGVTGAPAAFAENLCGDTCQKMIHEGLALEAQGKYQPALDQYRATQKAEPLASQPFSLEASLIFKLSARVKPELTEQWRAAARAQANRALKLWAEDPVALETLRQLDDDGPTPLHQPNAQAARLFGEAEALFAQQQFEQALPKYLAAAQADPQYSNALVDAADCHFRMQRWAQAETLFRRATEVEPRNSQAWRFLSDTLAMQKKYADAQAALYAAIAADPSQVPNWTKLAGLRALDGKPLHPLGFKRGVRVTPNADGKFTVNLDESIAKQTDSPDFAMRMMLGVVESNIRIADKAAGHATPPYQIELEAWRKALQVADELKASTGKTPGDPALLQMQSFARDGQLEPAILLLQFRQAYRPALEAWESAHPDGIRTFVDRYKLGP